MEKKKEPINSVKNTFEAMKKAKGKYVGKDGSKEHEGAESDKEEKEEHKKGGYEEDVEDEEDEEDSKKK